MTRDYSYLDSMHEFEREYFDRMGKKFKPEPLRDKRARITLRPHYSNPRFQPGGSEHTIWGERAQCHYDYSDRFWQWDWNRAKAAATYACENAPTDTALWVEKFISHFHGYPVEVLHIAAGINAASGYPFWVAGYRKVEDTP